jgi:hypothetical protein
MSLRKFGPNDVLLNTMRTYPPVKFFIYNGQIYHNSSPHHSGSLSDNVLSVTGGAVSLYEYNVDRKEGQSSLIYPFITKDSAGASFRTAGKVSYTNEFQMGDQISGHYPLTASISREHMSHPGARETGSSVNTGGGTFEAAPLYPHFYALKNRLDYYGFMSEHYKVRSDYADGWNKANEALGLISIPSIFFGSKIRKGSVSLKWYVTGTLAAEVRDVKQNGELIQVSGTAEALANGNGKVAGVVMYNEGFILLTGSWGLSTTTMNLRPTGTPAAGLRAPSWLYFGMGAQDGVNHTNTDTNFTSASFQINFEGQTDTQVYTMFAKAKKGKVNYSNNPTYIASGSALIAKTGSKMYEENPSRKIKNIASSSYAGYSAPFRRQVFISRVAIYDKDKNLIGLATLADPVLKEEDQDYTFKIKLDI